MLIAHDRLLYLRSLGSNSALLRKERRMPVRYLETSQHSHDEGMGIALRAVKVPTLETRKQNGCAEETRTAGIWT